MNEKRAIALSNQKDKRRRKGVEKGQIGEAEEREKGEGRGENAGVIVIDMLDARYPGAVKKRVENWCW